MPVYSNVYTRLETLSFTFCFLLVITCFVVHNIGLRIILSSILNSVVNLFSSTDPVESSREKSSKQFQICV